jgi:Kazal-type serine protease inhibitor domain
MTNYRSGMRLFLALIASLIQFSCASSSNDLFVKNKMIHCVIPKKQVCTREYRPVCGFENDGNHKTYSNACSACSLPDIYSYSEGACETIVKHD